MTTIQGGGSDDTLLPIGTSFISEWHGCVRAKNSACLSIISFLVKQSPSSAIWCKYIHSVFVQRIPRKKKLQYLVVPKLDLPIIPSTNSYRIWLPRKTQPSVAIIQSRASWGLEYVMYAQQLWTFSMSCGLLFKMTFLMVPYWPKSSEERRLDSLVMEGDSPIMYTKLRWMIRTLCR